MNRDIKKRIDEAVTELCNGNKSEFCRRIGRKADAIKDIIGGREVLPGFDLLYDILSSDLGISPKWLMLGEGPMLESEVRATTLPQNDIHHNQVFIANWGDLRGVIEDVIAKNK